MRHRKQKHTLGLITAHRSSLLANLCSSLIEHGRIQTTLAKAKALRPFAEKVITLAKKAAKASTPEQSLHYRRLAIARIRNLTAVRQLFDERASDFEKRVGGYTRIYKLGTRRGDAAEMALIELIPDTDEGYQKRKPKKKAKAKKSEKQEPVVEEIEAIDVSEDVVAEESSESKSETVEEKA